MSAKNTTPIFLLVINVTPRILVIQIANHVPVVIKEVKVSVVIKKLETVNAMKMLQARIVILVTMDFLVFLNVKVCHLEILF